MLDLKGYKLILASQSPRRRELLKGLDVEFSTCTVDADESFPASLKGADAVQYICKAKANAYKPQLEENTIAITADTVVIVGDKILGKPKDYDDACNMLRLISGKKHSVVTGVTVRTKEKVKTFSATSKVSFEVLDEEEIRYYVDTYKPFDKAGSYGIQEWIGYIGVNSVEGSYFNVMGLPTQKLYNMLKTF
jgi:septum formation protein